MSEAARLVAISPLKLPTPKSMYLLSSNSNRFGFPTRFVSDSYDGSNRKGNVNGVRMKAFTNFSQQGLDSSSSSSPVSIELEPILNESQFDRVIADAQHHQQSVVILWMANWCRKCIYLKPKLEKLAAHYHPRVRFYCIDVNNVPYKLVVRAGVTKMPTIQLWKDSKKQEEVIGGHKAYLVVNEVQEMLDDEGEP